MLSRERELKVEGDSGKLRTICVSEKLTCAYSGHWATNKICKCANNALINLGLMHSLLLNSKKDNSAKEELKCKVLNCTQLESCEKE